MTERDDLALSSSWVVVSNDPHDPQSDEGWGGRTSGFESEFSEVSGDEESSRQPQHRSSPHVIASAINLVGKETDYELATDEGLVESVPSIEDIAQGNVDADQPMEVMSPMEAHRDPGESGVQSSIESVPQPVPASGGDAEEKPEDYESATTPSKLPSKEKFWMWGHVICGVLAVGVGVGVSLWVLKIRGQVNREQISSSVH
mmetsp:Transcript_34544/g.55884  ORF Transcript_34544/g.55884 Transcript_34544/m.55884 type:complete len:202 (+) Transcript_34544:76-681(+)